MAVPSSGTLVMGKIYQEVDGSGYSSASDPGEIATLAGLVGGSPDSLNQNSTSKPNTSTPHSMSEWYGYDHSATGFTWGTPGTTPSSAFDFEAQDQTDGDLINAASTLRLTHSSNTISWTIAETSDAPSESGFSTTASRSVTYTGTLTTLQIRIVFYNGVDVVENNTYSNPDTSIKVRARFSNNSHITHSSADTAASTVVEFSPSIDYNFTSYWYTTSSSGNSSAQLHLISGSTSNSLVDKQARLHNGNVRIQLRANQNDSNIVTLVDQAIDMYAHTAKAGS
jgi:hypothetical protein